MKIQATRLALLRRYENWYVRSPALKLVGVYPYHQDHFSFSQKRVLVENLCLEYHVLRNRRKQKVAELVRAIHECLNPAEARGTVKLSLKLRQLRLLLSEKLNPGFGSLPLGRRSLRHGELARPGVAQCLASLVLVRVLRAHSSLTNRSAGSDSASSTSTSPSKRAGLAYYLK